MKITHFKRVDTSKRHVFRDYLLRPAKCSSYWFLIGWGGAVSFQLKPAGEIKILHTTNISLINELWHFQIK